MRTGRFSNTTFFAFTWVTSRRGVLSLLLLALLTLPTCLKEKGPLEDEFPIFVDFLSPGFDIGVTSSEEQYDWLDVKEGYLKMDYPPGQDFGSVFIVAGAVALERVAEDFSGYEGMMLELKADTTGGHIALEIEDIGKNYVHSQFAMEIPDDDWTPYSFPFSGFGEEVDLSRMRAPVKFVFYGKEPRTIYARNIRYLKSLDETPNCFFPLFVDGKIGIGYDIGVAAEMSANPDSVALNVEEGILEMYFPAERVWSSVFFYLQDEAFQDFSNFCTMVLEIRGKMGGEAINIGVRDTLGIPSDTKYTLADTWRKIEIPLESSAILDLTILKNPIVFTSYERDAQTVMARNIYFRKCK